MGNLLLGLLAVILIIGAVVLQVYLSKSANKWLGLALPLMCFIMSLVVVVGMIGFTAVKGVGQVISENGEVIEDAVIYEADIGALIFQAIIVFAVINVPTAILLLIHFTVRDRLKKFKEINKMNIQDLE